MGDNKTISIMLFGLSGDGKTSLLASLFRQMCYSSINKNAISYSLEFEDKARLIEEAKNLNKCFTEQDFFTAGTSERTDFSFILRIKRDMESYNWPIELNDYAGGSIDVFAKGRKDEELRQEDREEAEAGNDFHARQGELKDANIIFVLVDAIALARCCKKFESDVGRCAEQMNARSVNLTLSSIIEEKSRLGKGETDYECAIKNNDVTILFLLTKTDASIFDVDGGYAEYKDNNFEKLREMVKKIYQKVFDEVYHQAKVKGWSVGIVPVCVCGTGNVTTNIKETDDIVTNELKKEGKIEPRGIDTAFMYAIRRTFISRISALEKVLEEKEYQKAINQAANFLKLDENDNVIWECNSKFKAWLQDKEKAGDYKRIINNAKTGIEMKKIIQPQIEELKKMRDFIEEGYHFDGRNRDVYDVVEPVTGVNRVDRTRNVK